LKSMGRLEESFVAFESGRSLAHAITADTGCREKLAQVNPFKSDRKSVALDMLRLAQSQLKEDVLVAPVALVHELIAYIVDKEQVECVSVPLQLKTEADASQFVNDAMMVPIELQKGRGEGAIAEPYMNLTSEIAKHIASRRIASCMPHAFLHQIPWRALFRKAGLSWHQLSFATGFGLIVRQLTGPPAPLPLNCAAIGFNSELKAPVADNFAEEAKAFASAFGPNGKFHEPCTKSSLALALNSPGLCFVSCHASARDRAAAAAVWLSLSDGGVSLEDVLPEHLSGVAVLLSACESGVFRVADGDFPVGAVPELLRRGAAFVIGTRFTIRVPFAVAFFPRFAAELVSGAGAAVALAKALEAAEAAGHELWRDLASVELFRHQ